ncbi:matrix extracellular phosphoglycoprotein [Python bivittatus]|uniref:Matrix extracellular phosphoglycoprotein n=1 Tax=Python bivittatus TaxID=176946 RepID=A0A9F5MYQ4_PYTBI|nr:matrix extracellular phosphoglycoprotein [Python bivittatus]
MKTVLLYFCFCSLTWAQAELQSHYRKVKQKCIGEHQITVKGHHSKHGFYIFNYMYSSSEPENQTQIKKEDGEHISRPTHVTVRNKESRDPVDNLTEIAQVTNDEQKHLSKMGNDSLERTTENHQNLSGHYGNTRNWDFDQDALEIFVDKRRDEFSTGYITSEIEGSGDNVPDQVAIHHAVTSDNKDHDQDKDHQVIVKEKEIHSGIANNSTSLKHSDIKIGVKENDVRLTQEIKKIMSEKTKDPQKKDFSKVFLKGSTDAPKKQPDKEENGYINLLQKGKKDRGTSKLSNNLDIQSNLSVEFLEKIEPIRTGNNYTDVSKSSGIKVPNEKSISNATVYEKHGGEYTVIIRKLDRSMNTSKISKPHEKVEVHIISNSHVEEANTIKEHKKDGATEDVIRGQSNKHMEVAVTSRIHKKDYGKVDVKGRLIKEKIDPGKTNKTKVTLSGKLNSLAGRFEVTKPPLKGEVTFLKIISDDDRSDLNAKEQGKKGILKVDFTYGKSNMAKEDVGSTKALQKGLGSHEKINRKNHKVSLNDPQVHKKGQNRFGVTFQDVDRDARENANSNIGNEIVAELRKSNIIESSNPEAEYHGEKAAEFKSALSLSHGSHNNIQLAVHIPKNDHLKAQGHFLSPVKEKKVPKTGQKPAEISTGTYRRHAAKQHYRYGTLRRKSSQPNKKRQSVKKVHVSDSSQSSESDSRQSYEDYQNDKLSSESV